MTVKLVALDLDDTLLDNGLQISSRCMEAIRRVQAKGILVTLATGRMYRSALPYANQLQVDVPLITYQGALVKNSITQEVLYYKPLPGELARQVITYFKQAGVHYQAYIDDQLCMEALSKEGRYYSRLSGIEPVICNDLPDLVLEKPTTKILAIITDESALSAVEKGLCGAFGQQLNILRSKPTFLEAMHIKANKAEALKVVAAHYHIDRSEVLAMGDSYNDLAMIEWAGIGVAMGNAREEVKQAADYITLTNEEEGVAETLYKLILNGEE